MSAVAPPSLLRSLIKLARPKQWAKSAFVLIGPFYGARDLLTDGRSLESIVLPALFAAAAFALTSSACYIVNDLLDREADRAHPRKRHRPLAAGYVSPAQAQLLIAALLAAAAGFTLACGQHAAQVALWLALYAANVTLYSTFLKHHVMADVISLASGFVIRVMAGCVAIGIEPTVWLMNVTFFLSMFLAFGKRLGERRTLDPATHALPGSDAPPSLAAAHRKVQARYTDSMLQSAVVVSAAITLMTYALYVQEQSERLRLGYQLWLSILPLTYGLFRCIVLLEEGAYDDPTEIAASDRGIQAAALLFLAITVAMLLFAHAQPAPPPAPVLRESTRDFPRLFSAATLFSAPRGVGPSTRRPLAGTRETPCRPHG